MIIDFVNKVIASFDNTPNGFSARKLSAFITIHTAVVMSIKLGTPENAQYLVSILLLFALMCLGIVTAEQIIRYKDGLKGGAAPEKKDADPKL